MASKQLVRALVVGETADGKSTLVQAMLDPMYYIDHPDELPEKLDKSTASAGGTTDDIASYRGLELGDKRLLIYDTPGVGTEQCPIEDIMARISAEFERDTRFQCILVTAPATTTTPGAGAQVVRMLLSEGFCGNEADAWNHVILVGTRADRADFAEKRRFEQAVVPKFFEGAPPSCDRKFCFTSATAWDMSGNAQGIDVTGLMDKIKELPDLESFYFKDIGLTTELLEKVFVKILGKKVDEAKHMAAQLKTAQMRERTLLEHLPGDEKIKDERQDIKELLEKATSLNDKQLKAELLDRQDFLELRTVKKVNSNQQGVMSSRMNVVQLKEELAKKGLIKPLPQNGKYPRGMGFRFAAPPAGNKADIAWALYNHAYGETVKQKYLQDGAQPAEAAATATPTVAGQKRDREAPSGGQTASLGGVACRKCGGRKAYKSLSCRGKCTLDPSTQRKPARR